MISTERIGVESPNAGSSICRRSNDPHLNGLIRIRSTPFVHRSVTALSGRTIEVEGTTVIDFAHCGYLGVDHDLVEEDISLAKYWGLRNGWSRITGSTQLTSRLEKELATRLRFPEVRLAQSISLINLSIFYALNRKFRYFLLERDIHLTLRNGIQAAATRDGHVQLQWQQGDLRGLETQLQKLPMDEDKLIAIDGIYSMKGVCAPVQELVELCVRYNAVLFIDDAHGFGVEGQNGYGVLEQLLGFEPDRVIYVGSFSKCTSNPVAFVGFGSSMK